MAQKRTIRLDGPCDETADVAAAGAPKPLDESPPFKRSKLSDWALANEVLDGVQAKLREATGHAVTLDARHRSALQDAFGRGRTGEFWSSVDALYSALSAAQWSGVRNEASFIQSVLRRVLMPSPNSSSTAQQQQSAARLSPVLITLLSAKFGRELESFVSASAISTAMTTTVSTMSTSSGGGGGKTLDTTAAWDATQTVLDAIERRVSETAGRSIRFDDRHRGTLRALLVQYGGGASFWGSLALLAVQLTSADWAVVRGDTSFIQGIIPHIAGGTLADEREFTSIASSPRECAQLLLAKINRRDPSTIPQRQPILPPLPPPPVSMQTSVRTSELQARLESIYTWGLAERVLDQMGSYLTQTLDRRVVFDSKHRNTLKLRFHQDPLGFWSVLDQILEKAVSSNWLPVRNEGKFIQSWLGSFSPSDTALSNVLVSFLPQNSDVPPGMPPHIALRQQQQQPPVYASAPPPQFVGAVRPPPALPWDVVLQIIRAVEENVSRVLKFRFEFEEKHRNCLRTVYSRDPAGFLSILDQMQDALVRADWGGIRDKPRFVQSLINRPDLVPQPQLSPFMQSFMPPPATAMQQQLPLPEPQYYR